MTQKELCIPWLSNGLTHVESCSTAASDTGVSEHYNISEASKVYLKQTTENPHGTHTPATVSISAAAPYPCLTAYSPMKSVGQMCHILSRCSVTLSAEGLFSFHSS